MISCAQPGCPKPGSVTIHFLGRTRQSCPEHQEAVTAAFRRDLGWVPDAELGWVPGAEANKLIGTRDKRLT
jgi:hypothetical protein